MSTTHLVIDTSALLAIILNEAERGAFLQRILAAEKVYISTPTVLEAKLVVQNRKGQAGLILLNELLTLGKFEWLPPENTDIELAFNAYVLYGKGRGNAAQLNYGDLFSYAAAKKLSLPLLFKGDDFAQTDCLRV